MIVIVLFCRRNVGLIALSYLVAKDYTVKVISDDENVLWLAKELNCEVVTLDTMGEFDFFICVHGNKILPKEILQDGKFINIHPCLGLYKGHNPIKKYIYNMDTKATIESQYMIEEVDAGGVIHKENFTTPVCDDYADFYNVAFQYYFRCLDATLKILNK